MQAPEHGRILGLDLGTKKTGVAVSDESRKFSFPLDQIRARGMKHWVSMIAELVDQNDVSAIVVGVPLNQFGEKGKMAIDFEPFLKALQKRFELPVIEWDERLTTAQAERSLIAANVSRKKRKTVIDKVAAVILLQSYLDSLHFGDTSWDID